MFFDAFPLSSEVAVMIRYKIAVEIKSVILSIINTETANGQDSDDIIARHIDILTQKVNPTIESISFLYHDSKTTTDLNASEVNELLSAIQRVKSREAEFPADRVFEAHWKVLICEEIFG